MLLNPYRFGATVFSPYYNAVLADGPLLYWHLDEGGSTTVAVDASGHGADGDLSSAASTFRTTGLVTAGPFACAFPGTPDLPIGVFRAAAVVNTGIPWTFECVAKPAATPISAGVGAVMQIGTPSGPTTYPELDVIDNGSGTFKYRVMRSGVSLLFTTSTSWAYGVKHHLVLRYDSTTLELLVNGVSAGSTTVGLGNAAGNFAVGHARFATGSNYPLQAVIDEVALYQFKLSDARIAAHLALV